jgi:DNA-binding transcriptional regulator YiaG
MVRAYHYTESGLDNIYLVGGVTHHKTVYGEGISITNTDGLHKVIGRWLVDLPKRLNGAELRFLRLEMEVTQRDMAAFLGTTEQTISLWERKRDKPIPGAADRLLRALYSEYVGGDGSVRRMVDRLAHLEQVVHAEAHIRDTRAGWRVEPQKAQSGVTP